jgi:hypothetical protein
MAGIQFLLSLSRRDCGLEEEALILERLGSLLQAFT